MSAAFIAFAALCGLILGSFATCAGYRLARGGSVLFPARSYCPACDHTLTWRENIPLFGWLLQGGRCRYCRARIPLRYPLAELACGLYCAAAAQVFGPGLPWLAAALFGTLLLVLALIDLATFLLPDVLTLPGAGAALAVSTLLPPAHTLGIGWRMALLGAGLGFGGLWIISELYRRIRGHDGLGLGDAKLLLLVGALLGPVAVGLTLFWGACLALPAGLVAAFRPEKPEETEPARHLDTTPSHNGAPQENAPQNNGLPETTLPEDDVLDGTGMQAAIPFGPALCAAAALYLLYGPQLLRWWLGA